MHLYVYCSIVYNSQATEVTQVFTAGWLDEEEVDVCASTGVLLGTGHWITRTLEYYTATEKKWILLFATTWIDLEDIMLSEIKSEKDKYCIISRRCGI